MKFFFFHLMPYADLDLEFDKSYPATWVVLPNSYYDPEKGHKLYDRYLDELEYADELGFDGICVNEHHQTAYGMMPAPSVLAGALSRRTKNAKIAVLGRALPLLNNPLVVAEEFAILDNITGGRLVAGFVRGIGSRRKSVNGGAKTGQRVGVKAGQWHETSPICKGARSGPFAYRRRKLFSI
jgi:hypothetical protein